MFYIHKKMNSVEYLELLDKILITLFDDNFVEEQIFQLCEAFKVRKNCF